jgi:periplasmic divalent cation tolerance protein
MYIVIFVTAADKKEGASIARALIKKKLAACVNIIDSIESLFCWKGKLERAREVLLIIKSKKEKLAKIIKTVKSLHSYDIPEIIALPLIGGDKPYLRWIDESLRKPS